MTDVDLRDRFRGCLLGLATGDAAGTTLEFKSPGTFEPVTDMVGGGPFRLRPGQWTDDTSMALCLATSLLESSGFDAQDQMERYVRWYAEGYLSSTGICFDIGNTIRGALQRFRASGDPFAGSDAYGTQGNGSLMRLAPVPMYFYPDAESIVSYSSESSRTTHASKECLDACAAFGELLRRALAGESKERILSDPPRVSDQSIQQIVDGSYRTKRHDRIRGGGYVCECLEAALWSFHVTDTFRDAILRAANLGDDADTTAAVCGQLAGAFYGESGIPDEWLERLVMREEVEGLADRMMGE